MGRTLVVAATKFEVRPLLTHLGFSDDGDKGLTFWLGSSKGIDVLVTGVGQTAMAYHLGRALLTNEYSFAVNLGISGSFREELPATTVVNVESETFADLGAEDGERFLDLFELKLHGRDEFPFNQGRLCNEEQRALRTIAALPRVRGISLNTVLGTAQSVKRTQVRLNPDVVSMEGAAFFYACKQTNLPFVEIRSISDRVGPRDKASWNISGAIKSLNELAVDLIDELRS